MATGAVPVRCLRERSTAISQISSEKKGLRSDYLTAHSDCFVEEMSGTTYHAYPVGNERERLNQLFDALIADLKGMVNA